MTQLQVGKSKISGRGVFATKDLPGGAFIVSMKGRLVRREYRKRGDYEGEENFVPVALNWWVDPRPPLRYINHSCDPNTGFKSPRRVYALRNIKKGEEITLDYSTIEYFEPWDMPCSCGSKNCRKIIRSIEHLPPRTFRTYFPYIPLFLRRFYLNRHPEVTI